MTRDERLLIDGVEPGRFANAFDVLAASGRGGLLGTVFAVWRAMRRGTIVYIGRGRYALTDIGALERARMD